MAPESPSGTLVWSPSRSELTLSLPEPESIFQEDAARVAKGLPLRFAVPYKVNITPQSAGEWSEIEGGQAVWRLHLHSPQAKSINLIFGDLQLLPEAKLQFFSASGQLLCRPLTHLDQKPDGRFATPILSASDVVLMLAVPTEQKKDVRLTIESVNVGYRDLGEVAMRSGACNVDVACPEAGGWGDQVNAVGLLSVEGVYVCSGVLINNTARDGTPFFLTANHCGVTPANASTVVVYWNYENSVCRPPGSVESGEPGDGTLNEFQVGATWRAGFEDSDFTLLQLDGPPDPAWDVAFAGWDRSSAVPTSSTGIHHPGAEEKRISMDFDAAEITAHLGTSSPGDGTHLRVLDWDLGTTEAGSSGSPLFDQNHRVVGQLHGGFTACGNNDSIWYGRLNRSWTGGGTSDSRLWDWLDPAGTNELFIDHLYLSGLTVTPSGDVLSIGITGGPFTNDSVLYTVANFTGAAIGYQVVLTSQFGMLLNQAWTSMSGTIAAGASELIEVSIGPDVSQLPAGIYVEVVEFRDLTNGITRSRRHTVEIGQTLFSVSPAEGFSAGGPAGGPFNDTMTYTVTNVRPTPVDVEVSSLQSWISIDGAIGSTLLQLSGNSSDDVVIGFSPGANDLPVGLHQGQVQFSNLSGGGGDTLRTVTLDVGRLVYSAADLPQGITDFNTTTSTIMVPGGACIADLNVDVDIMHSYIGDLIVELTSPAGTTVRLHNSTGGSADNLILTYDDEGTLPDGPGMLSDFDDENPTGTWTLSVMDTGFPDSGVLRAWSLSIEPNTFECAQTQRIYSFALNEDPGWARQGLWAFGQPTGGGTHNRDPNAAYLGPYVFGYNLSGDYPNNLTAPQRLTTGSIDCSNISSTQLVFRRWLGVDSAPFDQAAVQISTDGVNWTNVWTNPVGAPIADASWTLQTFDISAVADGQPYVFIRWTMGPTNASNTYPGWNIDEIEIWGIPVAGQCDESMPSGVCCIAEMPAAEPAPVKKNRYLSMMPTNAGRPTALRVRLISLHHPDPPNAAQSPPPDYSAFEGEIRWVGPPAVYPDSENLGTTITAAALQCDPYFAEWDTTRPLHLFGAEVVPDSIYEVQAVAAACGQASEVNYSTPLLVMTNRWGDVGPPYQPPSPAVLTQPNISDIALLIDKFTDVSTAAGKPQTQLVGNSVNPLQPVNISDVAACVDAFKGLAYPYSGPANCGQ